MSEKLLEKRVDGLREDALNLANQLRGEAGGGTFDWGIEEPVAPTVEGVVDEFARESFDQAYQKSLEGSDAERTVGHGMVAKLRSDLMASMQQAYLLRHRTRIRANSMAASRLVAHHGHMLQNGWLRAIGNIEEAMAKR